MRSYTHFVAGGIAGALLFPELGILPLSGALLGSLLPDLDHPYSPIGKKLRILSPLGGKHRGWFHTIIGMGVLSLPFFALNTLIGIGVMSGYFSHLILDTLNPSGIMWLWPFSRRRFKVARIRTGSFTEVLVLLGLVLFMVTIIF